MKPEIIIVREKDGKVVMSVTELSNLLEKFYQSGYQDGSSFYTTPHITWTDNDSIIKVGDFINLAGDEKNDD